MEAKQADQDKAVAAAVSSTPGSRKRLLEEESEEEEATEAASNEEETPITADGDMPQKKFYRQRAHCNPLSHNDAFEYPRKPSDMDWKQLHFPELPKESSCPTVLDVGCGFGGLTVALSTLLPNERILGMEIRAKVTEYVRLRIVALRRDHPGQYQNASVLRTNSMKFLPNFFPKASMEKLFFCFPDPHFKRKNHGRRIISERLLSEYAYVLKPKGRLYAITDVKELHEWHVDKCERHPLFKRMDLTVEQDVCIRAMQEETEEGKKVTRNGGEKHFVVYERIEDDEAPSIHAGNLFD